MEHSGWIKLYRKLQDNPLFKGHADRVAVWVWLLLSATHSEHAVMFGGKRIKLKPGQLTTGRKKLASELGLNENKVQRILKRFETEHLIEQRTDHQCRLISILNWNEHQLSEQRNEQEVNNECTTSAQRTDTKQECKNEKNVNNYFSSYMEMSEEERRNQISKMSADALRKEES